MKQIESALFNNPTNFVGGKDLKMLELVNEFLDTGVEVTYVSPAGFEYDDRVDHVEAPQPDISGLGYALHLLSVLVTVLWRRPDVFVPFSLYGGFVGCVASIALPGTKTVVFIRGDSLAHHRLSSRPRHQVIKHITQTVERFTFKYADRIVFISEANRTLMLERTGLTQRKEETAVLRNNVYTDRVQKQLQQSPVDLDGDPVIGFAATGINKQKGVDVLIEAIGQLRDEYPDIQLYLLGTVDMGEQTFDAWFRKQIDDNFTYDDELAARVTHVGWVSEPIRYMQAFDLFVLPSLHEGLGNSLLEALASDTPIIGSDAGGIPEVVGHEELIFEPSNAAALAATIRYVFDDEERYEDVRSMCAERRDRFDFDWGHRAMQEVTAVFTDEERSTKM